MDTPRVQRLLRGDWSFGCAGQHVGNGTPNCPRDLHHHHDEFCETPTNAELMDAGIDPRYFKARSRK